MASPSPKKRPTTAASKERQGSQSLQPKDSFVQQEGYQMFSYSPIAPYGVKKIVPLLEEWIKDDVIRFSEVEFLPINKNWKGPRYCPYDRKSTLLLKMLHLP